MPYASPPLGSNRILQGMLLLYAGFWVWMFIRPYDVFDWWLENLLIIVSAIGLAALYRVFRFSNLSYFFILLFIALHTYGAHYSYNDTPIDQWIRHWISLSRNPFDRIVHFSFGLLLAYPFWEFGVRVVRIRRGWCHVITPIVILAFGAFYELIEMWVANIVSPGAGALFLGTQGDPWDSQHDMEVALYGALIATFVQLIVHFILKRRTTQHEH